MKQYTDKEMLNMRLVTAYYKGMKSLRKRESEKINMAGVTFAQFEVLVVVYHFQPVTVSDIINRTLSTIGNISFVISNLVCDGYLVSEQDEKDRRQKIIKLSEKGKKFMEDFFPVHLENLESIFSVYTEEEKEALLGLLKKMREPGA